jgi:endogenous inhibitor of DNA gyrase (YacG/DUF329 family)
VEYKKTNGNCNVSTKDSQNIELGRWVAAQRQAKKKSQLSDERKTKLNAIGFIWKVSFRTKSTKIRTGISPTDWDTRFEQLVGYKKANGDCNVSTKDSQHIELGRWVAKQRHLKKITQMSDEREAKLNSIGFFWNIISSTVDWDMRFRQLLEYKQAVGDCKVPYKFGGNPQLGHWVQTQRRANTNKTLTNERLERLNSIGFYWGKQPSGWIVRNQELEDEYKRKHHGLCDNGNNPLHLHEHLFNKRQKQVLETESVAELKTDNENCWDVHFRDLLAYLQTHGDFNIPPCYPRNPLLARWVSEQCNEYDLKRRGEHTSLTPLREAKLDAIGFTWIAGGTEEDAPSECVSSESVRPEEVRSGTKVKSENNGVAVPDSITSG